MHRPVFTMTPSGTSYFVNRRRRPPPYRDLTWTRVYEELWRLHQGRQARVQTMRDLETAYGRRQGSDAQRVWIGQGVPAVDHRVNRYLDPTFGSDGNRVQTLENTTTEQERHRPLTEAEERKHKAGTPKEKIVL
jgi:hypothetical protein